jgi:peptide/nickel transport system permease protein
MWQFLVRRLVWALAMTWIVASLALLLGRMAGSDIIAQRLGLGASQRIAAAERHARGLDRPLAAQYGAWIAGVARLDLGTSAYLDRPVARVVAERAANTALLAGVALVVALVVGIPLGLVSGRDPSSTAAGVIRTGSLLFISCPPLLMSLLLVWLAASTGLLPIGGMSSGVSHATGVGAALDLFTHLPVPALALALPLAASLERVQSESLSRAFADPALAAARARGLSRHRLAWHAVRLGAGPVLGVCGLMAGALLSGSFAVELVTSWPGLGDLTVRAMFARDIYLSAGCAMAATLLLSCGVVVSDIALAIADPRVAHLDTIPRGVSA